MLNHSWDISPREAIELQQKLAAMVRVEPMGGPVGCIAGVDCAFVGAVGRWRKQSVATSPVGDSGADALVIAAAVLCDAKTLEVIGQSEVILPCRFPYVPGLLSFREAPAVIAAVEKLPCRPDLLMIDGQGVAHPRGLGIASHVGLWLDLPTIGAAKSRLCGEHRTPGLRRGSHVQLRLEGRVIGSVVRTRDGVKPMFISAGHRVTLEQAIAWTVRCAIHSRLPEPTRRAHQVVTAAKALIK